MISENQSQLHVLVTDDNQSMRSFIIGYMMAYFKHQGVNITEAADGQEALTHVASFIKKMGKNFDIIIMDFEMPNMNGQEATHRIRELEKSLPAEQWSKIITWSSARDYPYVGADIALKKRFSPFEFASVVEALGYMKKP